MQKIARQFINLIKSQPTLELNLQRAVKELGVSKRRLYDVTNILSSAGSLEKVKKNVYKWIKSKEEVELEREKI